MTKMVLRIISTVLLLSTVCVALFGCSKTVKDAELRCPMANEPTSVDPQTADSSESMTIAANCYESLMKIDENGSIVLAAASDMAASPDGLTYTFRLKQDNKWHINSNHEEVFGENYETAIDLRVTAHDFVFGIQRALSPETKAPQAYRLLMIKNARKVNSGELPVTALGVTAIDDYTLQIQLDHTSSELMQLLTEPITAPCNRAFFEATKGRYGLSAEYVLCNGPFYLSRWYSGSNILLRRNPDNTSSQAFVYSVTYAFTQDQELIMDNLLDDKYAAAPLTPTQAEEAESKGYEIHEIQNTVWGLVFNCADTLMSNTQLRLALAMSINFDHIRSTAQGMSAAATGIIPPSCKVEGRTFAEVAPAVGLLRQDKAAAKKHFDEYTQGQRCDFTVLCTPEYENSVRKIIQDWQQLFGINLTAGVEVVENTELESRVKSGRYQCALTPITTSAQTPTEFLYSFRNGSNICRFKSSNFDTLLGQLLTAGSTQSVIDGCTAAQKYLIQNAVICPLFFASRYVATNPKITGASILHSGNVIMLTNAQQLK